MDETKQVIALNEFLVLLKSSSDATFAGKTVKELKREVEAIKDDINLGRPVDKKQLGSLVAPTGSLQETAIDNGWSEAFLRIANQLDP